MIDSGSTAWVLASTALVMLMTPGKPEELHIDLWNTAFTFEKAHKIQVTVTSSNSTKFEINPNTGEPFGVPTTTEPRVATNTVYFDKRHPSAMILPVVVSQLDETVATC